MEQVCWGWDRQTFYIMDNASSTYRVNHCSKCPGDTEYCCDCSRCNFCRQCKENHTKDLKAIDHNVLLYREKFEYKLKQEICVRHPNNVYIASFVNLVRFLSVILVLKIIRTYTEVFSMDKNDTKFRKYRKLIKRSVNNTLKPSTLLEPKLYFTEQFSWQKSKLILKPAIQNSPFIKQRC